MRKSMNKLLVIVSISVFISSILYGFMEQGRIVNPGNFQTLNFEINFSFDTASDCYRIELTGIENEIADIGSGVYKFEADNLTMSEEPVPFFNPKILYPDGETIERNFIGEPKEGMRKWMVKFSINKSQIEKTYVAILPPLNLSDGTTFVFDLPRFFSETTKKSAQSGLLFAE